MTVITFTLPNEQTTEFEIEEDCITEEDESSFVKADVTLDFSQARDLTRAYMAASKRKFATRVVNATTAPTIVSAIETDGSFKLEIWEENPDGDDDEYSFNQSGLPITWAMPKVDQREVCLNFYHEHAHDGLMDASVAYVTRRLTQFGINSTAFENALDVQKETHQDFYDTYSIETPEDYFTLIHDEIRRQAIEKAGAAK